MQQEESIEQLISEIEDLKHRLSESDQLIDAIKAGEVDAFAINSADKPEIYTLQSGDYAYRVLVEEFSEGALNVTEEGTIVYTNAYFFELLGLSYEQVIGALIFDFIHPDSLESFKFLFQQAFEGKCKGEINLRVNNKIIPVYISLTSLRPNLSSIGIIISDLTEKKKNEGTILNYQRDLEEKNLELMQRNAELASFAYLASHDLQEPLRKIQTFCNRILDKDSIKFSTISNDYFQRIISASRRMQNLIIALLNYSRLNTSDIIFKPADLNIVLTDVKNELREQLEENKVLIESSNLPTLNVIPLQFNQLFSNIILNSIKYRKPNVNPVIQIAAEIVELDETKPGGGVRNQKYWKIEITDNGIGFEQQYADRIFELFQRLHSKSEYEGTGIGLAICNRILQKHGGFIRATGRPNVGTTIALYIPLIKEFI